ncbi:hypothetical protein ACN267_23885 [Micromonospora sp. WMMD734]|uniref:Ig-like domain-containing protein n=1 Tax=Micromonospora humidisoli TaxID=2807622 RepID=A0ABS2J9Y2_9ACTN|nr:hypothetical protein [Micromonospora humidisoli]MBM7083323.1 hypothetical protein [Micromonospora humidisoli]
MPGRALLRTAAVALAGVLAAGGCAATTPRVEGPPGVGTAGGPAGSGHARTGSGDTGTVTDGGAPGVGIQEADPTGSPTAGGGGDSGGDKSGTKANGPTISSFRVTRKPSCPAGTTVNPIPGSGVRMEWQVGNATSVALSVDGPGVYRDDYPSTGSEELTFPCSGGDGDVQRHTYTLTARNAHGKQTKTIVVTAPVHDIPKV